MAPRFPGMDPWLENPLRWPSVHSSLIHWIRDQLVPQLRPRYFADVETRVYLLADDDPAERLIIPDVMVAKPGGVHAAPASGKAATPATAVIPVVGEISVQERRIVIRTADGHDVVTVLEVLSPTNKVQGSRGRAEYLAKRREVLASTGHLIEIDLLRAGTRFPMGRALPPGDYYAHVSRAERRPSGEVWAWTVRDAAPLLPVPLRGEEVVLDLGAAIRLAYERGGYDVIVEYDKPPVPPLSPEDAAWVSTLEAR